MDSAFLNVLKTIKYHKKKKINLDENWFENQPVGDNFYQFIVLIE